MIDGLGEEVGAALVGMDPGHQFAMCCDDGIAIGAGFQTENMKRFITAHRVNGALPAAAASAISAWIRVRPLLALSTKALPGRPRGHRPMDPRHRSTEDGKQPGYAAGDYEQEQYPANPVQQRGAQGFLFLGRGRPVIPREIPHDAGYGDQREEKTNSHV